MNGRIYLDNAATTPCRPEALSAMQAFLDGPGAYNPSSVHSEGRASRAALDGARERVASVLGARPREIIFTGGGSESDALAIFGVARARRAKGMHVLTVATEHHAVLHAVEALREQGWDVTVLPVDGEGYVSPSAFRAALRPDTTLASVMLVNNEIGTIAPIAAFAEAACANGTVLHCDAVQAPNSIAVDAGSLGVDLLSLSAHKFYGPKGVGVLYVRTGTPIEPLIFGGGQEAGLRAGTENVAGIAGLAVALELAASERPAFACRVAALRDAFEAGVLERIPRAAVSGSGAARVPSISNLRFPGADGEALLVQLDLAGIAVSGGSACSAGSTVPSHVIGALGDFEPGAAVRFSLGRSTTQAEVASVLERLPEIVAQVREHPTFVGTT